MAEPEVTVRMISVVAVVSVALAFGVAIGWWVTAGTIMHASKLPLTAWFWAAFLMATHSNGISALQRAGAEQSRDPDFIRAKHAAERAEADYEQLRAASRNIELAPFGSHSR